MPDTEGRDENSSGAGAPPFDRRQSASAALDMRAALEELLSIFDNAPVVVDDEQHDAFEAARAAIEAWDRRSLPPTAEAVAALEAARRIDAVIKQIAGKPLPIKFPNDEVAMQMTTIIKNAGTVARALLKQAAEVDAEEQVRSERSERANTSPALQAEVERLREGLRRMHQAFNAKKPIPKHEGDALEAMCRSLLTRSTEV